MIKRKKYSIFFIMMAMFIGSLCSFCSTAKTSKAAAKITFTKTKKTITAGKTFTFQAEAPNSEEKIVWSVSDQKIATVNQKGKLKAKRAGKVTITAKAGNVTAEYKVTVKGKKVIGIDPGHQKKGNSSLEPIGPGATTKKAKVAGGTRGVFTKVPEYKLTMTMASLVKKELIDRGYEVVMTREKNAVDISNKERAELINNSGADICIRLHADGAASASANGASALYPSAKNPYVSNLSKKSKALSKAVLSAFCDKTGARNRGLFARDDLTGTNFSKVPVIVLEMGFMTNQTEDKKMQTKDYQSKMVQGICDGIDEYFD